MYTAINAPTSGTVTAIHVKVGDAVEEGQHSTPSADRITHSTFHEPTPRPLADHRLPESQWQMVAMWVVVAVLLYLAIVKGFEPLLLVPISLGASSPTCRSRKSS